MKKIAVFLFVAMVALSAKAQVYVGGSLGFWHNDDGKGKTTSIIAPEIGYNINPKWSIGGTVILSHTKLDKYNTNGFGIAPYARYSYYENERVRLFVDGGFGLSSKKEFNSDEREGGFEIGLKPGFSLKLNDKFSVLAKCGFLGYRDDYLMGEDGTGLSLSGENLSFGLYYQF